MSVTSLNLSGNTELAWVSALVRPVQEVAESAPLFVVGAMARELIMVHGFGLSPARATRDLDFGIRVADWKDYERIREGLIAHAGFRAVAGVVHRLQSSDGLWVDLLPFGAVELADRNIAWPPEGEEVMTTFGFAEIADYAIHVTLPDHVAIDVTSPMGQVLLKLLAWSRRAPGEGSDAYDLTILLRNYLDAGQDERLYDEAADLLEDPEFDREVAGTVLLGRDITRLLGPNTLRVRQLLEPEIDDDGPLRLVGDMKCEPERALRLVRGLYRGLSE